MSSLSEATEAMMGSWRSHRNTSRRLLMCVCVWTVSESVCVCVNVCVCVCE